MLGADAIELARFNERSQQCPILGTLVAPSEQGVLGIELDRPHRTLDRIRVHLDAPVIKVERQAVPMTQRIAQSCQSASNFDPVSASNFDPFARRDLRVALVSSELAGIAETRRARVA